jgi:hypothetical protein
MTQKLNYVISRFAFHEMRMQANAVLTQQIKTYMDVLSSELSMEQTKFLELRDGNGTHQYQWLEASRKTLLESSSRLRARINHLEAEQRALLLEISCNSKIASSQLQIVSFTDNDVRSAHSHGLPGLQSYRPA